jgi:hypothetical protein
MSSEQTFQLVNESVSSQISVLYENIAKESAVKAVLKCAEMYGFDGNEALQRLGLISQKVNPPIREAAPASPAPVLTPEEPVVVVNEAPVVKNAVPKTKSDKKSIIISKPAFPLPYNGEMDQDLCYGLVLNDALFTQCQTFPKDGVYCAKCAKQCSTNEHGKPTYGTIQDRQKVGIMDYVDPKNRVPVEYVKVMNKYKVSREEVIAEAGKYSMTIDPIHFEIADKKKGRPKNPATRVVENTNEPDIFRDLISSKPTVEPSTTTLSNVGAKESNAKVSNNVKEDKAQKEAEKQRKLEDKAQKEAEKQRKLEDKAQKEAEKQRKLEEKKKPKEVAKKKAAAPKKKSEEAKKPLLAETKEPEKSNQDNNTNDSVEVHDTICFNYNGKEYQRGVETNNVYTIAEDGYANIVGNYDEATKTIIYCDSKLYDDEESEDSYDEEDDCPDYGCDEDDDDDDAYDNAIDDLNRYDV